MTLVAALHTDIHAACLRVDPGGNQAVDPFAVPAVGLVDNLARGRVLGRILCRQWLIFELAGISSFRFAGWETHCLPALRPPLP